MRHAAKVDDNQMQIVKALRACGYSVAITSQLGKGFPDLVVGRNGKNIMLEVKDENRIPSKRRLSEDERKFHDEWRGQIAIVENVEQAIRVAEMVTRNE